MNHQINPGLPFPPFDSSTNASLLCSLRDSCASASLWALASWRWAMDPVFWAIQMWPNEVTGSPRVPPGFGDHVRPKNTCAPEFSVLASFHCNLITESFQLLLFEDPVRILINLGQTIWDPSFLFFGLEILKDHMLLKTPIPIWSTYIE